jgi:hypothetical protein
MLEPEIALSATNAQIQALQDCPMHFTEKGAAAFFAASSVVTAAL